MQGAASWRVEKNRQHGIVQLLRREPRTIQVGEAATQYVASIRSDNSLAQNASDALDSFVTITEETGEEQQNLNDVGSVPAGQGSRHLAADEDSIGAFRD